MYSYEVKVQNELDLASRLQYELADFFHVSDIRASERGDAIMFVGRLARDAESIYDQLRQRFRRLGYTPVLRRERGSDIVVAQRGVTDVARFNPLINLFLFFATLLTTLLSGAYFARVNATPALRALLSRGDWEPLVPVLIAGIPFASTLLLILGLHEMGHYAAARLHRVAVTLPYFIPVPFGLGTFGAFIQMKSPVQSRKALFDVAIAGPIAGFVAAVPLMIVGLLESAIVPLDNVPRLGVSPLVRVLVQWLVPHSAEQMIALSPVAIAAWFGLLVTGFNLLPVGQLDGGHFAYAIFGRAARPLALATFAGLLYLGFMVWSGWYMWAFFALVTGLKHPEPLNDITPLDWGRRLLGLATLGLLFLLLSPRPL